MILHLEGKKRALRDECEGKVLLHICKVRQKAVRYKCECEATLFTLGLKMVAGRISVGVRIDFTSTG